MSVVNFEIHGDLDSPEAKAAVKSAVASELHAMVNGWQAQASKNKTIMESLVAAADWQALCPSTPCDGTSMAGGYHCSLYLREGCPRYAATVAEKRTSALLAMGIGKRYLECQWDGVPGDIRPRLEAYCANIAANVEQGLGIFLGGGVGSRKTGSCTLLARAAWEAHIPCKYIESGAALYNAMIDRNGDLREWLETVKLLIVDDLDRADGRLPYGGAFNACDELFNTRYQNVLSTIVVSNQPWSVLRGNPPETGPLYPQLTRSLSRWEQTAQVIETRTGDTRRKVQTAA